MEFKVEDLEKIRTRFGPLPDDIPETENDLNDLLFNRQEKVGKFIDFNLGAQQSQQWNTNNLTQQIQQQIQAAQDEFMMVESKAEQKLKSYLKNQNKIRVQQTKQQQMGMTSYIPPKGKQTFRPYQRVIQVRTKFKESGFVKADWDMLLEVQKQQIDKITLTDLPQSTELFRIGQMYKFDQQLLNKMNKQQELKMNFQFNIQSSTSDDPFINQIVAQEMEEGDQSVKKVFITEEILINIMTIKQQVVPWDIKVLKEDNIYIFDKFEKRDENNNYVPSYIDLVIANENTSNNMPEEEKEFIDLCKETSFIHNSFQKRAFHSCPLTHPIAEPYRNRVEEELEQLQQQDDSEQMVDQLNYKYLKFTLPDKQMEVYVRAELNGYIHTSDGQIQEVLARVFNEYDLVQDMRGKLVTNKGALITSESKNNLNKICKWLCQAQLNGIQDIQLGFVSRASPSDAKKQTLLAVDTYTVQELANILTFRPKECWAVFAYFVEQLAQHQNDYYALVKVPFKPNVKLYHIPDDQQ